MDNDHDWNDMYRGDETDYERPDPLVLELAGALPPGRALDVGCGPAGLLAALAERGWQVTGVDIADKAIAAARAVLARRNLRADLHVGDSTAWTPPGTYDLITSTFALPGSVAERAAVFAMMRAALAPGGTVLIKDFDPSMKKPLHFEHYVLPSVDELVGAFDGLDIVRAEVVDTPVHEHAKPHGHGGETWTAALLHARRRPATT